MKPYTVVLRRPEALYDLWEHSEFIRLRDSYTALVFAEDGFDAVKKAKAQVRRCDNAKGIKASDYVTLVVFEGEHAPIHFGWQTGVDE